MPEANKPITFLSAKLDAVALILKEAGIIRTATIEALAAQLQIASSTLKAQKKNGAISLEAEHKLCILARFLKTDPAWDDVTITQKHLIGSNLDGYAGTDTPSAFRDLLRARLLKSEQYRVYCKSNTIANREVGHHELEDSSQGATQDTSLPLFLEASFGPFRHSGLRYGFKLARLEVDVICAYEAKTKARFAKDEGVPAGKATLFGRGTARAPAWQIEALADTAMLDGLVNTTDSPLMELIGFQHGTIVKSRLLVDPHDGVLSNEVEGANPLSGNQKAIIEMLSAMALSTAQRTDGKVELSFSEHEVRQESFRGGGND